MSTHNTYINPKGTRVDLLSQKVRNHYGDYRRIFVNDAELLCFENGIIFRWYNDPSPAIPRWDYLSKKAQYIGVNHAKILIWRILDIAFDETHDKNEVRHVTVTVTKPDGINHRGKAFTYTYEEA